MTKRNIQPVTKVRAADLALSMAVGIVFGVILIKAEVVSWFRIQEMFRFQSFHMYGIIGSAIGVGAVTLAAIKRLGVKTIRGERIEIRPRRYVRGYSQLVGGIIFGLGWALLGACPGPVYALIGQGATVLAVSLLSAFAGAWAYGALQSRLPH